MAKKPVSEAETSPAAAEPAVADPPAAGRPDPEALVSTDPLADLQRERDDYYDRWMRKAAEFENYRRRVERERREQADQAIVDLLLELLLIVDDFDRAATVETGPGGAAYRKGMELIHAKLQDMLGKQGVRPIEALGADFDPTRHQAVMQEASPDHREGEVIAELRKGYTIKDRLLRPSMVKVAKA